MSIDLGKLLAAQTSIVQAQREFRSWVQLSRLGDRWETVELRRGNTYLTAQTVRIEFAGSVSSEVASAGAGVGLAQRGILFGLKDHPTLPDLNVKEYDTFVLNDEEYTITHVNRTLLGQIQCFFEVM